MKLESILQLKELVREKDARLAAIDRRLAMLAGLVKSARSRARRSLTAMTPSLKT